ncbi:MAG: hypothetical protein GDA48_06195 [Hormoscilla sp. GM102CHS1]|nr:hypothetical protein [Hormoscilla sp. GM102CHS1]
MSNRQYTGPMRLRSAHTARGGDRGAGVRVGVRGGREGVRYYKPKRSFIKMLPMRSRSNCFSSLMESLL